MGLAGKFSEIWRTRKWNWLVNCWRCCTHDITQLKTHIERHPQTHTQTYTQIHTNTQTHTDTHRYTHLSKKTKYRCMKIYIYKDKQNKYLY